MQVSSLKSVDCTYLIMSFGEHKFLYLMKSKLPVFSGIVFSCAQFQGYLLTPKIMKIFSFRNLTDSS